MPGSSFQILGHNQFFPNIDTTNDDIIIAGPAVISPIAGIVVSVSIFNFAAAGNIRVGVYSNTSPTTPNALLGESVSTAAVVGWQEIAIVTPPSVTQGQIIWLATQFDDNGLQNLESADGGGLAFFKAQAYGAFPGTFPGGTTLSPRARAMICRINPS